MSTPFLCGLTAAWALTQLTMALVFFGLALLRRERQYRFLVVFQLAMVVASGGIAGMYAAETVAGWRLAADIAAAGLIATTALNLVFVTGGPSRLGRRGGPVAFLIVGVLPLLPLSGYWRIPGTERLDETWFFGVPVRHVSTDHHRYAAVLLVAAAVAAFVAVGLLVRAQLRGRRSALPLVVGGAALAIAQMSDVGLLLGWWVHGVYLFPHALILYSLTIGISIVMQDGAAAQRLAMAEQSLDRRTEQLQRSYQDLRAMEGELFRREQLAAVGELAATIAHEVRNPLAVILNAAAGLRRSRLTDGDRDMLLGIVEEEVGRLNRLVTDLLRFARPVSVSATHVQLKELIERTRAQVTDRVEVEVELPTDPSESAVTADAGLLRLVLENLVENACQAMPEGGRLTLVVRAGTIEGHEATSIEVRDTGRGMDGRTLERARKPFFTTRPQGTGLGLAIVDRILRAHGGVVELESAVGRGTTVRLLIPRDEEVRRRRRAGTITINTQRGG